MTEPNFADSFDKARLMTCGAGAKNEPLGDSTPVLAVGIRNAQPITATNAAHLPHIENPDDFTATITEHLG